MAILNKGTALAPASKSSSDVAPFGTKMPKMYTAELLVTKNGKQLFPPIVTPLPENYQFQLGASWDSPMNQPLSSIFGGGTVGQAVSAAANSVQAVSGATTRAKWLSGAVWTGGNTLEVSIPFVIQAYEDTTKEVVEIMRNMLKLVSPSETKAGTLVAPGPTVGKNLGVVESGEEIVIRIGEFFVMRPCVIESVNCAFDTQMDEVNHCPMSATITVTAKSFWTTTKEDLDKYFSPKLTNPSA